MAESGSSGNHHGADDDVFLGGSLMPPEVVDAMRQASECFVDLVELQAAVGQGIAELTLNEAAFVSGGAAAGLFLAAAVCIARDTEDGILRPAQLEGLPRDFIIHRARPHPVRRGDRARGRPTRRDRVRNEHDGGRPDRGDRARNGRGSLRCRRASRGGALPLETVVGVARQRDIPVIVDAAAQLPPVENLWRFSEAGGDIVLFSGGKSLCGPASTGSFSDPAATSNGSSGMPHRASASAGR